MITCSVAPHCVHAQVRHWTASSPALDSLQCRSLASSRPPRGIRISTAHNSSPFSGLTSSHSPLCLCDSSTTHHSDALTALCDIVSGEEHWHHISTRSRSCTTVARHKSSPAPKHPTSCTRAHMNVFKDQCVTPKCTAYTLALLVNFPTRAYFGCYGYSNVPHYHAKLDSPSHYGIMVAIITHVMLYRYHPAPMQSKKSSPSLLILTFLLGQTQCRYSWLGEH